MATARFPCSSILPTMPYCHFYHREVRAGLCAHLLSFKLWQKRRYLILSLSHKCWCKICLKPLQLLFVLEIYSLCCGELEKQHGEEVWVVMANIPSWGPSWHPASTSQLWITGLKMCPVSTITRQTKIKIPRENWTADPSWLPELWHIKNKRIILLCHLD